MCQSETDKWHPTQKKKLPESCRSGLKKGKKCLNLPSDKMINRKSIFDSQDNHRPGPPPPPGTTLANSCSKYISNTFHKGHGLMKNLPTLWGSHYIPTCRKPIVDGLATHGSCVRQAISCDQYAAPMALTSLFRPPLTNGGRHEISHRWWAASLN